MTDDDLINMYQREFYGIVLKQYVNKRFYYHTYITTASSYNEAKRKGEEEVERWLKYSTNGEVSLDKITYINKRDLDKGDVVFAGGH